MSRHPRPLSLRSAALSRSIRDTAFLVTESRARSEVETAEVYSTIWIPEERRRGVRDLWNRFAHKVYAFDQIEVGMRTLFFFDKLRRFLESHGPIVFVNIGAGFTAYQYLLPSSNTSCEIDLPDVIAFKRHRADLLMSKRLIPQRTTHYHALDLLLRPARMRLAAMLTDLIGRTPSFVLVEGLTYYLSRQALTELWQTCAIAQRSGSLLAFDYWPLGLEKSELFGRLTTFYSKEFCFAANHITTIDEPHARLGSRV